MKKLVLLVLVGCMLTACAGIEITQPKKEEIVWTTANLVGFLAIQKYEKYAVKAAGIAQKIQSLQDTEMIGDTLNPLVLELSLYLSQEKDIDPVLAHGITLLLPMIHVKPGLVPDDKMELLRSAASGYLAGVATGKKMAAQLSIEDVEVASAAHDIQ